MKSPARILLIEDEEPIALLMKQVLEMKGYQIEFTGNGSSGLIRAQNELFDVVVTDLALDDMDGLDLIKQVLAKRPKLPIILITAHGSADVAIEATRLGAFDYLNKPFTIDAFVRTVAAALASGQQDGEILELDPRPRMAHEIIGKSRAMEAVGKEIGRITASDLSVLITGESGTGKELVARAIHRYSHRTQQPFVAINCMAIPEALLESELFGHERGAFTGASRERVGWFELANHGTLFLDEIGDMSPSLQGKLLRSLQERQIQRVGGRGTIPIDVRVIAATNRDLLKAIYDKLFREDLYYRLSAATIALPPLRDRKEDICHLVSHFLRRHLAHHSASDVTISLAALQVLERHSWPGNVRELEHVIQRAVLMARNGLISREVIHEILNQSRAADHQDAPISKELVSRLLDSAQREGAGDIFQQIISLVEREVLSQAIQRAGGNQSTVAEWLGISRPTARQKLAQYGLLPE